MISSYPDPGYAQSTLERFTEVNKSPTSEEKDILLILSSYSHFLGRAIIKDPEVLKMISSSGFSRIKKPEERFISEASKIQETSASQLELMSGLRTYKYRELSRIIYRDIKAMGDFRETMEELSDLASSIIEAVFRFYRRELRNEFRGEFVILGMGKLGGRELNLSSDIDLIYIFQDSVESGTGFKLAERITKALGNITEDGFLYRVDLGLRPGGGKSPIAVSFDGALEHYFYWGDTWERAALIKARPIAGDFHLGDRFIEQVEPFVYKKYLDYTSIEDLKDMKTKLDKIQKKGDVKLGKGGIREIEFFIQALQLVNGGAIKEIREKNTLSALSKLSQCNIIQKDVCERLSESYIFLRNVEHSIQLVDERQTHALPTDSAAMDMISKSVGLRDSREFEEEYIERTSRVSEIYEQLFYEPARRVEEEGKEFWELADFLTEGNVPEAQALGSLKSFGFRNPETAIELIKILLDPKIGALTQRGRMLSRRVVPAFLKNVLKSSNPDFALINLERFITGIGFRTSLFGILAENPEILKLLSRLFSTSGYLSSFLIRHPEYLDAIILKQVRKEFGTKEEMVEDLNSVIGGERDYEGKLDAIRRFKHTETLKLCFRDLNNEVNPEYVGRYLSTIAEASLEVALSLASAVIGSRSSKNEDASNMVIIGLGKLGAKEMSYNSDLDIIFVYEGKDQDYFSRLGQKIISILSIPTGEGIAYKTDMGLRPSGRAGALVSSLDSFNTYHEESAKLWERQALIRSNPSAGNMEIGERVMSTISYFVYDKPIHDGFHKEIHHLRSRMEKEIARETIEKLNLKTGRGGLVDIEFLVQMLQLRYGGSYNAVRKQNTLEALDGLHKCGLIRDSYYEELKDGLNFLKRLENLLRLLHDRSISELYESDFHKLALEMDLKGNGERLKESYNSKTGEIRRIYDEYFSKDYII